MGESAQLKKFGRNFANLGEFPPNQQIFGWTLGRNSPKSKEIRLQILGRNLTARIHPFSGEQKLLCRFIGFSSGFGCVFVTVILFINYYILSI
jgi:hypothetical protein